MGVCCSKTAKETGASSPRHYVSISGSPSSFPTENECKQDSALARGIEKTRSRLEKAVKTASVVDFNEKSSRSVFIVDPAWEAKHRPGEKKDSWENLVHKPRSNGQRSEQSSTENEDGDNKVILLKPRCSGAMRRLKKKDSKRQPNYKDEIMLTDNIDSIVEREIPEVPDYARSLAKSPGPGCSHAGITRPSSRRSKKKNVNKLARSNEPNAKSTTASIAGLIPGPKEIYAKKRSGKACDKTLHRKEDIEERDLKRTPLAISSVSTSQLDKNCARGGTMEEEDIRMLKEVKNILKDDCLNFANKQTTASAGKAPKLTGKGSSKKEIYVKPSEEVVEEADVQAPTATSSSQMLRDSLQNLSTEVRQLNNGKHPTNRVNCVLKDVVPAAEIKGEFSAGRVSPPKNRQRPKQNSTMQMEMTEEEKLAADIEYILNDDIPATESNGQNSTGKVPPPKNRQRPKENSTMQKEITEEEKLEDDIEYIWNDIPAVESSGINGQVTAGTVSPKEKAQEAKKKSLRENNLIVDKNIAKDVKDNIPVAEEVKTPLSPRKVLPKNKKTEKEKKRLSFQELEQAEDNLAKVVKDGSNEKVISGFGALPPPTKGFTRKHSKHADEQLAKDIEHILHEDDIFAVEPEVAIPYSPSETPRPKTRNPKRLLAMEMDRIFDPESIDCSPLAEDRETVDGMSNATMSTGAAPRPRNKTRRRKLKYMTIVEGVSEETDSNASVISACLAPPLQNSLSLSSGTEKHHRAHSTRKKETTEDKAVSEDRDQTLKGHLHTCKSLQPISSSSGLLPRPPKTRNPKRMSANNNQSSSPAASSSRTVILPKQDSLRKPKQEPQKDVASNGSNASSVRAGTRLRKKHPTRQPKETDETTVEIPTRGSGASVENHTDVAASIKNSSTQSNNARHIEEFNLDEAIEESLGIPATDTGASVENRTDVAANLKEKNSTAQPSKSKHTEEIDLNEAIKEILGISILGGDSKQAAEPNSMRKERKTDSRKKVTGQLHCMDTKKPAVQTASVPDIGFPDSKASSLGVETMNCDSGCSVASGDTMRPMAAGSSSVKTLGGSASSKTVKLPSSHISRKHSWKGKQTLPAILLKDETIVRKPRMRASRETAEPSLGGLQGMETHRNAAVPVTDGNNIGISSGIFYEPQELELMKQIERQSRCC